MIYASVRFDDAMRVAPTFLEFTDEALLGLVWQTKVERRRRGTTCSPPPTLPSRRCLCGGSVEEGRPVSSISD